MRLTGADQAMNGVSYTTALQYNVSAMTRTLTYPGQQTDVVETYDGRGRLNGITYGARDLIASSAYDLADRMIGRSLGSGIDSSYNHDANGWLELVEHVKDTLMLEKIGYDYDKVGNVLVRDVQTPGFNDRAEVYEYDTLHRLTRFDRGTLNQAGDGIETPVGPPLVAARNWSVLDHQGNWRSFTTTIDGEGIWEGRGINAVNEYGWRTQGDAYEQWILPTLVHDDNGNLTEDGAQFYAYDAENRLIDVAKDTGSSCLTLREYAYDALGRRVRTTYYCDWADGAKLTTHVYAGGAACLAEYDSTESEGETCERWFVHGPGFPDPLVLVDLTREGDRKVGEEEYLYYLKDLLGSVTALANSNGAVVERYVYDPYGGTIVTEPDGDNVPHQAQSWPEPSPGNPSDYGNPFMWTGQRYNDEVGLYHFLFRSYSPEFGRWLQRDPLGYVDSANRYEYVRSNPLAWIDPFGLDGKPGSPPSQPQPTPTPPDPTPPSPTPTTQPSTERSWWQAIKDFFQGVKTGAEQQVPDGGAGAVAGAAGATPAMVRGWVCEQERAWQADNPLDDCDSDPECKKWQDDCEKANPRKCFEDDE